MFLPGARGPVRPEADPALLADCRRDLVRAGVRTAILTGAVLAGAAAWMIARWGEAGLRTFAGLIALFCAASLLLTLYAIRQARRLQPDTFPHARQARRHWQWVRARTAGYTWTLVGALAGVALLTFSARAAVEGAGLVKPAVWDGEVWRMLTGPMLHAGFYHAWVNLTALFVLGSIVEAHTSRHRLPAILLVSVIAGSTLSLLLSSRPSIGASGGVMGLVGFLWMMSGLRPSELPDDFRRRMTYVIGATAVLGIVAFEFIDNWAHLGGLLAGAGMGRLLLGSDSPSARRTAATAIAGIVSLLVLLASMVVAVAATWRVKESRSAAPYPYADTARIR